MKRFSIFSLLLLAIFFSGCKTQEDIRRERTVEKMNEEIQQTKSVTQSANNRFGTLEEQINRLTGQIEEANHAKNQALEENKNLSQRVNLLEETSKKQVEYLKALTEKVNNQSDYIAEVLESLKKISAEQTAAKKKIETKKEEAPKLESTFKNGYARFQAKDFAQAKIIFSDVTNNKKASKTNREGSLHYLGVMEFNAKNYEAAKVYFTKVFTENDKSSFAASSLLYLGKTFQKQKLQEEAKMTFEELISRFPQSKEAKEAKTLLK